MKLCFLNTKINSKTDRISKFRSALPFHDFSGMPLFFGVLAFLIGHQYQISHSGLPSKKMHAHLRSLLNAISNLYELSLTFGGIEPSHGLFYWFWSWMASHASIFSMLQRFRLQQTCQWTKLNHFSVFSAGYKGVPFNSRCSHDKLCH